MHAHHPRGDADDVARFVAGNAVDRASRPAGALACSLNHVHTSLETLA